MFNQELQNFCHLNKPSIPTNATLTGGAIKSSMARPARDDKDDSFNDNGDSIDKPCLSLPVAIFSPLNWNPFIV